MEAVATFGQNPRSQLLVGLGQRVKLAQRHEVVLDVFDATFYAPFLGGVSHRTRIDYKGIAVCQIPISTLYRRLVIAGPRDRALRVVDPHLPRYAIPGKMKMQVIAAVAEFERDLLIERTQSGIVLAKAAGKQFGRPPALNAEERAAVVEQLDAGATIAELAREFKTTRQTIMRVREAALKP